MDTLLHHAALVARSAVSTTTASVLVVGAGAVGQVFAARFKACGARVELLVRPAHRDSAARPHTLTTLRTGRSAKRETWQADVVHVDSGSITTAFDLVVVTVPSTALSLAWLRPLCACTGDALVLALQPDVADHAVYVDAGLSPARLVGGQTAFVAFADDAGVSWWAPPGPVLTVGGASAQQAQALLKRAGWRARVATRLDKTVAFTTAIVTTWIAALAAADYSLALGRGAVQQAAQACAEALRVVAHEHGPTPPLFTLATSSTLARAALWLAPHVVPFPLERYISTHFTKVAAQQRLLLQRLVSQAERHHVDAAELQALLRSAE